LWPSAAGTQSDGRTLLAIDRSKPVVDHGSSNTAMKTF
jgi:hypothetical protein